MENRIGTGFTYVDPALKANAERVLSSLGLTSGEAITIFLNQVVIQNGLPFDVIIPSMTKDEARAELLAELKKGDDCFSRGEVFTLEESKELLGIKA
ncbi:MAG: type II toxin-antitoxin system RelB/DinJ family antitoxin [Firmicutes bacterium]|nr:type II toxin-antitoxin system RelB/DinJ family antitoxin [Bacillota bacterium]